MKKKFWKFTEYYKNNSIDYDWVKKIVSKKEWNDHYSDNPAYCFIRKAENQIEVGFISLFRTAHNQKISDHLAYCDNEDLRIIQAYREANHIFPLPLYGEENVI